MISEGSPVGPAVRANPRGIPFAPFVDRVEEYVTSPDEVEPTLRKFQEMISKYQYMEASQLARVAALKGKTPEIGKSLEAVRFLKTRRNESEPIETNFPLADTLYTRAKIPPTNQVYLWLGANVMLAYPLDEAEELLASKLAKATESLENCEEDVDFLREQITTVEVAMARVYNWDVVRRRKDADAAKSLPEPDAAAARGPPND